MAKDNILRALVLLLCYVCLLPFSCAIWLNLPSTGTKCVSEEIQSNVVVLCDYTVISDDRGPAPKISVKIMHSSDMQPSERMMTCSVQSVTTVSVNEDVAVVPPCVAVIPCCFSYFNSVMVTSPYGNSLHHTENVTTGQFAFTTTESGNYLACFWLVSYHQAGASVSIDWRNGIAARDWDSVARKEKIEGVELELRKLEGAVEAIHENLLYLKNREAEMRTVSETTNSRVAWFSIMSLGVCIGASVVQLWHLKRYFQKKKLI